MMVSNRNRDFCAYGLYLVERFRTEFYAFQRANPDHHLWLPSAYELLHVDHLPENGYRTFQCFNFQTIADQEPISQPLEPMAVSIKAAAALLRYAHLSRIEITALRCCVSESRSSLSATNAVVVIGETSGFGHLRMVSVDRPRGGTIVLQGGDPDVWFNTERWSSLESIIPAGNDRYPLSTPMQFSPSHRPMLVSVGARPTEPTWWLPPPGSANDDLAEYVLLYSPVRGAIDKVSLN
jgi:hypothetical protein